MTLSTKGYDIKPSFVIFSTIYVNLIIIFKQDIWIPICIDPALFWANLIYTQIEVCDRDDHSMSKDQNELFKVIIWNDFFRNEFGRNLDMAPK